MKGQYFMNKILASSTISRNRQSSTASLDGNLSELSLEHHKEDSLFLKPHPNWKPTRFVAVILEKHWIGEPDELAFLPTCSSCGEVISDLKNANIETPDGDLVPSGEINGIPISRFPHATYAFHLKCGPQDIMGVWKRLHEVVLYDQRYEWER
jgi:hypothetical protein